MKVLKINEKDKIKAIFHKNDKKILSLLCYNVRIPISKIARLLKLSRQSTEYRIKSMGQAHLIAGSRTVINIRKLGYHSYYFFLNLSSRDDETEFIKRCDKSGMANTLVSYSGKFGFEVSVMSMSSNDAKGIFEDLVEGLQVNEVFPCILTEGIKASILPGFIPNKIPLIKNIKNDPSFSKQFSLKCKNYKIDIKDKIILFALAQDAKIKLSEIAKKISLTRDAVSYRIKNLIKSGYILQFRPVIDYSVLDLSIQAVLIKGNYSHKNKIKFKQYLKSNDRVLWATEMMGNWDYLLYVIDKSQNQIHEFIEDLKDKFGSFISGYEILYAYQEHKYSFMTKGMSQDN